MPKLKRNLMTRYLAEYINTGEKINLNINYLKLP